jgi:hypothetical protein
MWLPFGSNLSDFKLCHKTWSTADYWKSLYAWLIPTQSSSYLHPCTVQLWLLTCLCEQMQYVHCRACWHLTLFCFWIHVPTLQGFNIEWHNDLVLLIALHDTTVHFCDITAIFSAHFTDLPSPNKVTTQWRLCTKCIGTHADILADRKIYEYMSHTFKCVHRYYISPHLTLPHTWP